MTAASRILCCVPFCPRWRRADPRDHAGTEWICWDHWKAIPLERRKAYFRAFAEYAPLWLREQRKTPRWMLPRHGRDRLVSALDRLWRRLKRDAIERAL